MKLIDAWLLLDEQQRIRVVHWQNDGLAALYSEQWHRYLGRCLQDIAEIQQDKETLKWKNEIFYYDELRSVEKSRYLLLKQQDKKQQLYEHTLDKIQNGVQIYDQNACLVYLNKASRKISSIPGHLMITGKHLFDLYDLKEEVSSVMTTLRTGSPVINRLDQFKSTDGNTIYSINTAYPLFQQTKLIGSVVFEQNIQTINALIEELTVTKEAIKGKDNVANLSKFNGYHFTDLIGSHKDFLLSVELAKKIAPKECNVLLVGETGTGKEIFAQSIHKASLRKHKRFVAINCAAVPETLIENILFGSNKGSFTGSVNKTGLIEEADGGTLFLDELNSMSLSMQSKMLRVIQEGVFRRVGGNRDIRCDVRFISSCNHDPLILIEKNMLRNDLFYRLSAMTIEIPPLRARQDDLKQLIQFYLTKQLDHYVKSIDAISPPVLALFQSYAWPGNVRELFNVLDYILNTIDGSSIELQHLPKYLQPTAVQGVLTEDQQLYEKAVLAEGKYSNLQDVMLKMEKEMIENALLACRYNVTKTAELMGLSRQNLQYRMKKLGLS